MKERGGIMTTITFVIAAVLGITYLPRSGGGSGSGLETQRPAARLPVSGANAQSQATAPKPSPSCEQIARRLRRFYPADVSVPMPTSCYSPDTPANKSVAQPVSELSFAIAVVPNPVQTHLPLMFDRAIESIQQAAQDVNYAYDGSWFPWNHSEKAFDSLSDEEQAAKLEAELQEQPGIMVFRSGLSSGRVEKTLENCERVPASGKINSECPQSENGELDTPYTRALVVFVVAEQPTGGISDTQFEHALQWMQNTQPDHKQNPLLILGPTFSGRLPSLARELDSPAFRSYVSSVLIYSGTTNSEPSIRWFHHYLQKLQKVGLQAEFRTFFESDSLMTDRFLCYLRHEGYNLSRVAILSEDETAFGNVVSSEKQKKLKTSSSEKPHPNGDEKPQSAGAESTQGRCGDSGEADPTPTYLYYPRDIASLRSAYEQ